MTLSSMHRPTGPSVESCFRFTDGTTRTVFSTDIEVPFPEGRLIVSRTDLNGLITHANDAFVEMSGYARDQLIGQPHHILRHPDMPKIAFQGLWDDLVAGKKMAWLREKSAPGRRLLLGVCHGSAQYPSWGNCGLYLCASQAITNPNCRIDAGVPTVAA